LGLPLPVKYKVSINHCLKHRIEEGKKQKNVPSAVVQFTSRVTLGYVDLGEIADAGDLEAKLTRSVWCQGTLNIKRSI